MWFKKNFKILNYLLLVCFCSEFMLPNHGQANQLLCLQLFVDAPQTQVQSKNKWAQQAEDLGLVYVTPPVSIGYQRKLIGQRTYFKKDGSPGKTVYYYRYFRPDGSVIRPRIESEELERVRANFSEHRIDPTWPEVWITANEKAHIQMWAKSRYGKRFAVYHDEWNDGSSEKKFDRVATLKPIVNRLRNSNDKKIKQLQSGTVTKDIVEALALKLLLSGRIRVGSSRYRDQNGTYGVTTLLKEQLEISGDGRMFLKFVGKSGNKDPENPVSTEIEIVDPILKSGLLELKRIHPDDPRLLIYPGPKGLWYELTAVGLGRNLNDLQVEISKKLSPELRPRQRMSVKDLRTWAANVTAVQELLMAGPPPVDLQKQDRIFKYVALQVSLVLNNTPGVSRKNYIDPRFLTAEGYVKLWSLAQIKYPGLLARNQKLKQPVEIDSTTKNYDPRYEDLLFEFWH